MDITGIVQKIYNNSDALIIKNENLLKNQHLLEIKKLITQTEPFNLDVDENTRNKITQQIRQSAFYYFSDVEINKEKWNYVHFVFSFLRDIFKTVRLSEITDWDWNTLLPLIKQMYNHTYDVNQSIDDKEYKLAIILKDKYLKNYKLQVTGGRVDLEINKEKLKKIAKKIDSLIKEIGGLTVLNTMLNILNKKIYKTKYRRYIFASGSQQYGTEIQLDVPWNYLLNLCKKNIARKGSYSFEKFDYLLHLSSQFLYLYDLQTVHSAEKIFIASEIDKENLYKRLYYSNIFRVQQANWDNFPNLLENLLAINCNDNDKDKEFITDNGFPISDYIVLVKKIYNSPQIENCSPTLLSKKAFTKKEIFILDKLSNKYKMNLQYLLPTDFDKIQDKSIPIIDYNDNYLLINKAFCAWKFYNFIADINKNEKFIKIGTNIENIVKERLTKLANCIIYSGTYKNIKKEEAECDAVYSDDKYIIFFETKKKTISKDSLFGKNKSLLLYDLSAMIVNSQSQAFQHEYDLRNDGKIVFKNGETLIYHRQKIYRVSITLFDLNFFNDHAVTMSLIKYLRDRSFRFIDEEKLTPEQKKEALKEINLDGANKKQNN